MKFSSCRAPMSYRLGPTRRTGASTLWQARHPHCAASSGPRAARRCRLDHWGRAASRRCGRGGIAIAAILGKAGFARHRHLTAERLQKSNHGHHFEIVQLASQGRHGGLVAVHHVDRRVVQRLDQVLRTIAGIALVAGFLHPLVGQWADAGQIRAALALFADGVAQRAGALAVEKFPPRPPRTASVVMSAVRSDSLGGSLRCCGMLLPTYQKNRMMRQLNARTFRNVNMSPLS